MSKIIFFEIFTSFWTQISTKIKNALNLLKSGTSNIPSLLINCENFDFGTNLGLTIGIYFTKTIFDIKIETGIFKIQNVPISINSEHF